MEVVETLIKMMWWYGRGLPPRRLGIVVYDWGGFSAASPGQMRIVPASIADSAKDVLTHAERSGNVFGFNSLFEMQDVVEGRIKNVYRFWFQFSI